MNRRRFSPIEGGLTVAAVVATATAFGCALAGVREGIWELVSLGAAVAGYGMTWRMLKAYEE